LNVTDRIGIVGGLRYSNDKTERKGTFAPGPGPWPDPDSNACVAPADCVGFPNNSYQKASKLTWRGGLNFQVTPSDLLYASVATGYKPGGFNDFDPILGPGAGPQPYSPEQLTAYEAGYKGRPFDWLRLDSGFYYYDYSKAQISSVISVNGSTVLFTRDTPETLYGWENEATFDLGGYTNIALTATVQHSRHNDVYAGIAQNVDWSGDALDKTPDFTGSIAFNHAIPVDSGAEVRLRWFTKYSSSYTVSNFVAAVHLVQDDFTRSDASVTYAAPGDAWTVQAFVENIENDVQLINGPTVYSPSVANGTSFAVSTPRFYGVRLGVKF
jgi:iron complex outermembrane receptor protein